MLRFAGGAAHLSTSRTPPGWLPIGSEAYSFVFSKRRLPRDGVVRFLANLPCPCMIASTTTRGQISLILRDELTPERRAAFDFEVTNQTTGLEEVVDALKLAPTSRLLLSFADETHVFTLAALRLWVTRYLVDVGWMLLRSEGNEKAEARLWLVRADGTETEGRSCSVV